MRAGIDEAGRGPVVGPLVAAGVAGDPDALHEMGCRDSKTLTPAKRERLDRLIRASCNVALRTVEPASLDVRGGSLNTLEAHLFRDIAAELVAAGAQHVTVDAADVDPVRFGRHVAAGLPAHVVVESRHQADATDPCVAAASIVAKVARDAAVAALARRLERKLPLPLGSGYSHDARTRAFLAAWHERFGGLPEGTRRSWAPARAILAPKETKLAEYAPLADTRADGA